LISTEATLAFSRWWTNFTNRNKTVCFYTV